ncbi:MAG TPA: HisA/HisF-related TIM barrel protein [Gemmataceae bacterium]|nr:HisA/HisF-related TIM barrel protein [Gemmataceae bacterium]
MTDGFASCQLATFVGRKLAACGYGKLVRIIPVLDVMNGVVVRGVGGRRSEYRPIVSKLTSSTDPVDVARALVNTFRPRELYLADLDAIGGAEPAYEMYRSIRRLNVDLWVDAGVRDASAARRLADADCEVVAGLETVPDPETLREILIAVGAERVVFSLDLRDGIPLRRWLDPIYTVDALGIARVIVLDLARVGGGAGTGTETLCREIATAFPHVEVIAGGGIRGPEDLKSLKAYGAKAVLVASALHNGRISPIPPPGSKTWSG